MDEELVLDGYRPGALARVIALHMDDYGPAWGFGLAFESKLAREMGAFLARLDPERDLFLAAYRADGTLIASITIDGIAGGEGGAHLRWFIVAERADDAWSGSVGEQRFERRP